MMNISMQESNPALAKLITWAMLAQLAYMPFANIVHSLDPRKVFGYALWVTVLPSIVMLLCYSGVVLLCGFRAIWPVFVCIGLGLVAVISRSYWIGQSPGGFGSDLNQVRYFALLPMYLVAWREVIAMGWPGAKVQTVLLGVGGLMAGFGILHLVGLPTFYQAYDAEYEDPNAHYLNIAESRYTGTVGGSNVYGNVLLVPMVILTSLSRRRWRILQAILIPIILLGILSSGSRLAMGAALVAVIAMIIRHKLRIIERVGILTVVSGFALFSFYKLSTITGSLTERFENLSSGDMRLQKSMIAIEALRSSWESALIGVSSYQLLLDSANANQFSDNSFLQVATNVGIPATVGFILVLLAIGGDWSHKESFAGRIAMVLFFGVLLLNNAILWNVWLFMACAALWLIRSEARAELPDATPLRPVPFDHQPGKGFPQKRLQFGRTN